MQRATLVLRTNPILPSRQLRWQDPIWSCKSPHLYSTMVVYSFTHRWRPSPSFTELNGGDISTVGKMTPTSLWLRLRSLASGPMSESLVFPFSFGPCLSAFTRTGKRHHRLRVGSRRRGRLQPGVEGCGDFGARFDRGRHVVHLGRQGLVGCVCCHL